MEKRVWMNPRQPQTLHIAHMLMYFQGGFGLLVWVLGGLKSTTLLGSATLGAASVLLATAGKVAAAYGIANERRWGYRLGVAAAAAPLARRAALSLTGQPGLLFSGLLGLIFDVVLLALLLHPHSRSYQRRWRPRR